MRRYRFCLFDHSGEALFADVFECAGDGGAKEFLKQQLSAFPRAYAFELWELNRLVLEGLTASYRSKVDPLPPTPPSAGDDLSWSVDGSAEQKTTPPLTLRSERLRAAHAYWLSKRNGRAMPSRADIDPTEIPTLLPYIILIDVLDPLDFRYRLIGTEVRNISRRDYTGLRFSEVDGKGKESVLWQGCEALVRSKAPRSHRPPYVGSDAFVTNCENVLLPLSNDQTNVNMILKVISFERARKALDRSNVRDPLYTS
ncbi:MAG TPA: PAS domain-containing protein [Stellaceae bacterium]|nr:PAS domain-containing protein [Stellaceae bacterium]